MKWQWKLGNFAGIDVFVHATFLLIVGWYGLSGWLESRTIGAVIESVAFILLLFGIVVLHEYGHALTARRFGIQTRDITLYPIGGVARLERMPDNPWQELWVALAGPLVNVVLAAGLYAWLVFSHALVPLNLLSVNSGELIERLMLVNVTLALFNLIPAFPMDGGRVLRALLALRFNYVRATRAAAIIGQGLAFVFGLIGLFTNPMLVFIAFFVWAGAAQEANLVQMKSALDGILVTQAMESDFKTLNASDPLWRMAQLILAGSQRDFPVLENGRLVGLVSRGDFLQAINALGDQAPIAAIMRRDLPAVDSSDLIEIAVQRLQSTEAPSLPVVHAGSLVGIITQENIREFLQIRSALQRRPSPASRLSHSL